MTKPERIVLWLVIGVWLAVAIYGLIFNITYIDEAKYLIKGWLITTGQVSYYRTPEVFYQHMPGGLLWYGLGQKIFGPNLLVGRLQSLLISLLVFGASFLLGKRLTGEKGGLITLAILSLAPATALYYSAAIPQSLLVLMLMAGFICLYDGLIKKSIIKFLGASVCFSLALIVRENFLFTLILYLGFLGLIFRHKLRFFWLHLGVILLTLGVFMLPGLPGTLAIFKNFPGVSYFLPVSLAEKQILSLYWKGGMFTPALYFRAVREFGIIFHAWILLWLGIMIKWLKQKPRSWTFTASSKQYYWLFLSGITGFNFLIHSWAAFQTSPRAIVTYFTYVTPLVAVIMAKIISPWVNTIKQQRVAIGIYLLFLVLAPVGLRFVAVFALPTRQPDLRQTYESARIIQPIIKDRKKIVWIDEPLSLYLNGRISYYPLINHTGFYKPSDDTATVRRLGFWNLAILQQWLDDADLVVLGDNKLKLLKDSPEGIKAADFIETTLEKQFRLIETREDLWSGKTMFYEPKAKLPF